MSNMHSDHSNEYTDLATKMMLSQGITESRSRSFDSCILTTIVFQEFSFRHHLARDYIR